MYLRDSRLICFSKFLAIENCYVEYCQKALTRPFLHYDVLAEYARLENLRREIAELFNCSENLGRFEEYTFVWILQEIMNLLESVREAKMTVGTSTVSGYNVLKHRLRLSTQVVLIDIKQQCGRKPI